jgi:hypothetical protein
MAFNQKMSGNMFIILLEQVRLQATSFLLGLTHVFEVDHKQTLLLVSSSSPLSQMFSFEKGPIETLQEFEESNTAPWHDEGYFF